MLNPQSGSAQPPGLPEDDHKCMSESIADQINPVDGELDKHLLLHANGVLSCCSLSVVGTNRVTEEN